MRSATIFALCIVVILQCLASISTAVDLGDDDADAAALAARGQGLVHPRRLGLLQNAPARSRPLHSAVAGAGAAVEVEFSLASMQIRPFIHLASSLLIRWVRSGPELNSYLGQLQVLEHRVLKTAVAISGVTHGRSMREELSAINTTITGKGKP
uniref:Uncharacterized protein n=1 Tax=Oryza brachyantha TaxID=4533 RepID=J3M8C1_ORYBR